MKYEAKDVALKCDAAGCGWTKPCALAEVPTWHHKPCPKCGAGEIINDEDMAAYILAQAALDLSNALDPEGNEQSVEIIIDTAKMREGAEVKP